MKAIFSILIGLICWSNLQSQVALSGVVRDLEGMPLPYANVVVVASGQGTVTNDEGYYQLSLPSGEHRIAYSYVGYTKVEQSISLNDEPVTFDASLAVASYDMQEVVIAADAEDPAYPIMRRAIGKRAYYAESVPIWEADVYIKGRMKLLDAPQRILGSEIGNLGGLLDSSRQGIIYLTESQSTVYRDHDDMKEVLYASKTSGDDRGLALNTLSVASFDFYKERVAFARDIISPLSDQSFRFYRFELAGSSYNEAGKLINKIKVIPKDKYRPVVSGYLYIIEDQWNLHSLDLDITGKAMKSPLYSNINLKQSFVPVENRTDGSRRLFSQVIDANSTFLGFKLDVDFTYIFNQFKAKEALAKGTIDREIIRIDDAAERDSLYWVKHRPIPLTIEEETGYAKRDSLNRLWNSKAFLDSIDRAGNVFQPSDIFTGYTHENSYLGSSTKVYGLASWFGANAVEGWTITPKVKYERRDDSTNKFFSIVPRIRYGTADKKWKGDVEVRYGYDQRNAGEIRFSMGRRYDEFGGQSIHPLYNTLYSLMEKQHVFKLFQNDHIRLGHRYEVSDGLFLFNNALLARRKTLQVNSDFSLFHKDREFEANDLVNGIPFNNDILSLSARLLWFPGLSYISMPRTKIRNSGKWPALHMGFEIAVPINDGASDYSRIYLGLSKYGASLGLLGSLDVRLMAGKYLNNEVVNYMDYKHFNTRPFHLSINPRYGREFKYMPLNTYADNDQYALLLVEHHLNGLILDKVPFLRDRGAQLVASVGALKSTRDYTEVSIGLEKFRIAGLALFRLDYVWSWDQGNFLRHGLVVGIGRNI